MGVRVLVLALGILCVGRGVRAGDADDLIRQGVERRRQGDDVGALGLFERAYQAAQSPRALAQMGLAEQSLGKWVVASEHLKQALAANGDPWIVKNRSVLNEAVTRVGDHVGWLEIFGGTPGAEVRLDGTPRGTLPLPGPITTTTGTLAIELVMGGHVPLRRTTSVRAGEKTREAFDALAVDSTGTPTPGDGGGRLNATQPKRVADIARAAAPLPIPIPLASCERIQARETFFPCLGFRAPHRTSSTAYGHTSTKR